LSAPNQPPTGQACEEYADVIQHVLADTDAGVYEVTVPIDGCGHYLTAALSALNAARRA